MTKILVRLLLFLAVVATLKIFGFLIVPLLVAGIIAILIEPFAKKLEVKYAFGRGLAAVLVVICSMVALGLLFTILGFQITEITSNAPQYADNLSAKLQSLTTSIKDLLPPQLQQAIAETYHLDNLFQQATQVLVGLFGTLVGNSLGFLSVALVVPLYVLFILIYRRYLKQFFFILFENSKHERISRMIVGIYEVIHHYIRGVLTVMLIVGILNTVGLWLLGIPSPLFFGFFAAFLTIIPYIGVFIGSLLPILVAFVTTDSLFYPIATLILFVVVQFLEGNFITPKITGSSVNLNPLVGIASLVLFGWLWGTIGVVIAYPMTAIVKIIFDNIPELKAFGFLLSDFDNNSISENKNTNENLKQPTG